MTNGLRMAPRFVLVAACFALAGSGPLYAQSSHSNKLPPLGIPPQGQTASVPVGGLAGGAESDLAATVQIPDHASAEKGRDLYVKLNCADCHGYDGKGGMGPDLTDKMWIFGGTPAEIFKSIYEGRPEGMPSWGKALPPKDIWQLVAYIQTLGGTFEPSRYQQARQGDHKGELVAPEINFEQELDGSPPYPLTPSNAGAPPEGPNAPPKPQ